MSHTPSNTPPTLQEWIKQYVTPGKTKVTATRISLEYYDRVNELCGRGSADVPYDRDVHSVMRAAGFRSTKGYFHVEFQLPDQGSADKADRAADGLDRDTGIV